MKRVNTGLCLSLCVPVAALADHEPFTVPVRDEKTLIDFSVAADQVNQAAHLQVTAESLHRPLVVRFSASVMLTDDVYGGADIGFRYEPMRSGPFVGLGVFYGQNEYCDDKPVRPGDPQTTEVCDPELELAVFPEAGVNLWLGKRLRVSVFARYYYATSNIVDGYNMYGISLGFK